MSDRQNSKYKMRFGVWSYRFRECAISFYSLCCFHHEDHLSKCMRKAFSRLKFRFGKEPNLYGHIFPFMGTSSSSWAHLSLHGHIFPFMGTSSFMAHLPLHGHIFPFMGASSPSWAHPSREGILCRNGYRFGYRSKPETSPPARRTGHLITFSCLAFRTENI